MSNNLKRQVIHHLAEQGIPANYDPWNAVKMRLEGIKVSPKTMRQPRIDALWTFKLNKHFIGAMLFILSVAIVFFLTPQGQVTAKNLFELFRKADSNILPLPTGLPTEPMLPTRTRVPTQVLGLQPISTGESATLQVPTPKGKIEKGTFTQGLTITQAEELAQFAIPTPKSLPSGYQLTDVWFDSETRAVQQFYKYFPYQAGELFILTQEFSVPDDSIGQSAEIEQIRVGDIMVEAVSGAWFSATGSNQSEWINDSSAYTFRWQQDGFTFTVQFMMGDTFSPAYLTKDKMQAVVEVVIGTQSELPANLDLNNLKTVEEVKQVTSFPLLAPTLLPEGFILERAVYEPENQRAILIYRPNNTAGSMNHPSLIIFEVLKSDEIPPAQYPADFPAEAIEQVKIGEASGILTRGAIVDGRYDPSFGLSLHWETNSLSITINYSGSSEHSAQLEKVDMIKLAEGLR